MLNLRVTEQELSEILCDGLQEFVESLSDAELLKEVNEQCGLDFEIPADINRPTSPINNVVTLSESNKANEDQRRALQQTYKRILDRNAAIANRAKAIVQYISRLRQQKYRLLAACIVLGMIIILQFAVSNWLTPPMKPQARIDQGFATIAPTDVKSNQKFVHSGGQMNQTKAVKPASSYASEQTQARPTLVDRRPPTMASPSYTSKQLPAPANLWGALPNQTITRSPTRKAEEVDRKSRSALKRAKGNVEQWRQLHQPWPPTQGT